MENGASFESMDHFLLEQVDFQGNGEVFEGSNWGTIDPGNRWILFKKNPMFISILLGCSSLVVLKFPVVQMKVYSAQSWGSPFNQKRIPDDDEQLHPGGIFALTNVFSKIEKSHKYGIFFVIPKPTNL